VQQIHPESYSFNSFAAASAPALTFNQNSFFFTPRTPILIRVEDLFKGRGLLEEISLLSTRPIPDCQKLL
jgi:hypothetical protein